MPVPATSTSSSTSAGAASSAAASTSNGKSTARKLRPARKQVQPGEIVRPQEIQTGKEYNIWFHRWSGGDREENIHNKVHAPARCIIARDSGYTRADGNGTKYCCLLFARGCCPRGLPLPNHELPDISLDCFGREKHADYRDDMSGVGSFERQNRTLYVGKIREGSTKADTEEIVRRHFSEWGEIIRLNVLHNRGVAFVTYASQLNAQFAKEAMVNQSLDGDEILNVRWATEDPNPAQIRRERKRMLDEGTQGVMDALERNRLAIEAVGGVLDADEAEVDAAYAGLDGDEETGQPQSKRAKVDDSRLLGGSAMDNIRHFAEIAKQQALEAKQAAKEAPKKTGVALLGDYGSDSE